MVPFAFSNGILIFDEDVHILYRQHDNNTIGMNNSISGKIKQKFNSIIKKDRSRSKIIINLYECYKDIMNNEDKYLSELVVNYNKNFFSRIKLLLNSSIKTKYFHRNIYYKLAVILNVF